MGHSFAFSHACAEISFCFSVHVSENVNYKMQISNCNLMPHLAKNGYEKGEFVTHQIAVVVSSGLKSMRALVSMKYKIQYFDTINRSRLLRFGTLITMSKFIWENMLLDVDL